MEKRFIEFLTKCTKEQAEGVIAYLMIEHSGLKSYSKLRSMAKNQKQNEFEVARRTASNILRSFKTRRKSPL